VTVGVKGDTLFEGNETFFVNLSNPANAVISDNQGQGTITNDTFNGNWFSPKTRKELTLNLIKKDTAIEAVTADTRPEDIFGHYHYQYSEAGYQGDFEIKQLPGSKAIFGISSVTGEPARNIAQIDDDTISLHSTGFTYTLPGTDNCAFEVKFYKAFVYIKYTKGFCEGQFGHNATIDGIFLKIEDEE